MRKLRLREGKSLIQGPPENQLGMARWEARSFPDPLLIPNPHLEVKKKKKKKKTPTNYRGKDCIRKKNSMNFVLLFERRRGVVQDGYCDCIQKDWRRRIGGVGRQLSYHPLCTDQRPETRGLDAAQLLTPTL